MGCAATHQRLDLLDGLSPQLEAKRVRATRTSQDSVLRNLAAIAGLPELPDAEAGNWTPIVSAGLLVVDQECARYLASVFWWDRARQTALGELSALGAAGSAIMGMTGAAAQSIALLGVAVGATGASIATLSDAVLYSVSPTALQSIVSHSQQAYRAGLESLDYTSRTAALEAISGYLALCLPVVLEAQIEEAVKAARFEIVGDRGQFHVVPRLQQVPKAPAPALITPRSEPPRPLPDDLLHRLKAVAITPQ
jgi:hypothetical protein